MLLAQNNKESLQEEITSPPPVQDPLHVRMNSIEENLNRMMVMFSRSFCHNAIMNQILGTGELPNGEPHNLNIARIVTMILITSALRSLMALPLLIQKTGDSLLERIMSRLILSLDQGMTLPILKRLTPTLIP